MIISPQSLDTNLSQLLAEVKSGSMQLPEFQREFAADTVAPWCPGPVRCKW